MPPGWTVKITVSFSSKNETAMSFWRYDRTDPNERFADWPGCGNYDNVNPRTFEYTNETDQGISFSFNMGYKDTPPDPNQKWHFSPGVWRTYPNTDRETVSYPGAEVTVEFTH
jgi:hypothetical protein